MNAKSPEGGFSLLESTVAVAILALALPPLFSVVRSAVARLMSIERQDADRRMVDNLMTEAVGTLNGEIGVHEGRQGDLVWRVETTRADPPSPDEAERPLLYIKVTLRSAAALGADQPLTLDALALAPARP